MASLTDHDTIDAGLLLQSQRPAYAIPISVERTVPYEQSYFHLGVHNLPPVLAVSFMSRLAEYTHAPHTAAIGPILEKLAAEPAALIVLNHPLWDMAGRPFRESRTDPKIPPHPCSAYPRAGDQRSSRLE